MSVDSPGDVAVDVDALREEVEANIARSPSIRTAPTTSIPVASLPRVSDMTMPSVASLPDAAVESFAGVANPFSLRPLAKGEQVVDVGSGAGFDAFVAASQVGPSGTVVGVDMTEEMLAKSRSTAAALGMEHVEFREGLAEHCRSKTAGPMSSSATA